MFLGLLKQIRDEKEIRVVALGVLVMLFVGFKVVGSDVVCVCVFFWRGLSLKLCFFWTGAVFLVLFCVCLVFWGVSSFQFEGL